MKELFKTAVIFSGLVIAGFVAYKLYMISYTGANPFQ